MKLSPGIDCLIGETQLFDFFKIEEPLALHHGMQGHYRIGSSAGSSIMSLRNS
jgi:hypothetical protein